jgi:hypothetical protein
MAMTTPYDVNIISMYQTVVENQPVLNFTSNPGTIDRDLVTAYYVFTNPITGEALDYTMVHLSAGGQVILDMTYAAFDAIINP